MGTCRKFRTPNCRISSLINFKQLTCFISQLAIKIPEADYSVRYLLNIRNELDVHVPGHCREGDLQATDGSHLVLMVNISLPLEARATPGLKYQNVITHNQRKKS